MNWKSAKQLPPLKRDFYTVWPTSDDVLGFFPDESMRVVRCEQQEDKAVWFTTCSEGWVVNDLLFWTELPNKPDTL